MLPELAVEPSPDAWRQAWLAWCQARGLPVEEASTCQLQCEDYRLRVTASARFLDRLRAARSEALKGEAWLFVESGSFYAAALIELMEAPAPPS